MEKVICLDTKAFYSLLDEVVEKMMKERKQESKWVSAEEPMEILKTTSKTTLHKLKNEGHIQFSQPLKKLVVYDGQSLLDYLEKHAHEPFQ